LNLTFLSRYLRTFFFPLTLFASFLLTCFGHLILTQYVKLARVLFASCSGPCEGEACPIDRIKNDPIVLRATLKETLDTTISIRWAAPITHLLSLQYVMLDDLVEDIELACNAEFQSLTNDLAAAL